MFSDFQYGFNSSRSTSDLLIELLAFLIGLRLLKLQLLIYPRLMKGFVMLVFFTNVSLMEFQVRYLALFHLFLIIDGFRLF